MKKNITLIVLTITTIVSLAGWISSAHMERANAATTHQQKVTNHKQKNLSLKNDDTINTKDFTIEYHRENKSDYTLVVTPTDKNQRIIGQQGEGAQGIELINVDKDDE